MKLIVDEDANHSLQFNPERRGKRLRDFVFSKIKMKFLIILVFDNHKVIQLMRCCPLTNKQTKIQFSGIIPRTNP